jgi:hypothetical protein
MAIWLLVKSDLLYNYKRILLNVLFLFLFSISVIADLEVLNENNSLSLALWPLLVSIGSVLLVIVTFKISLKEERNRIHLLLPVDLNCIAYARLIAGAIQLTGAFTYLIIVHHWLINKWAPVTDRVFYQFGSYIYIMSVILFIYYFVRALPDIKMLYRVILAFTMFIGGLFVLFFTDNLIFNIMPHYLLGIIYFLTGMFFYFVSGSYFARQKSFLEKVLLS